MSCWKEKVERKREREREKGRDANRERDKQKDIQKVTVERRNGWKLIGRGCKRGKT